MHFNPRSLAGATIGGTAITPMTAFQSTLPRGSDTSGGGSAGGGAISIHAPSRERLSGANTPIDGQVISIHAPSRERLVVWIHIILISLFQSTLPRGSDMIRCLAIKRDMPFQSTLPRGSDHFFSLLVSYGRLFQSTLPRGSDQDNQNRSHQDLQFQSTLPRGSDRHMGTHHPYKLISIHAPSRERPEYRRRKHQQRYFNPRSLAGATPFSTSAMPLTSTFQSTLPRGSDFLDIRITFIRINFNPRSLAGATSSANLRSELSLHFNPRSLAGATGTIACRPLAAC